MSGCFLAAGKGAPKLGKKEIGTLSAPTAKHEGALVWDVGSWVSKNTESLDWMKPSDPWGQPRWGYEQKAVDSPGVWIGRVKMPKGTESAKPGAKEGDTDGARRVELIRNGSVEIFGGPLWP
jgi:hypothetical protein